jgi:hypothetical protein
MKKLYFLDEAEANRILNLHESATKKQYLSEQRAIFNQESLSVKLNDIVMFERAETGGSELKLFGNVVFTKENDETLTTKPNTYYELVSDFAGVKEEDGKGTIKYSCRTKYFTIEGRNAKFYNENYKGGTLDAAKAFDYLCAAKSNTTTDNSPETLLANAKKCGYNSVEEYKKGDGVTAWLCPKKKKTVNRTQTQTQTKQTINYADYGI